MFSAMSCIGQAAPTTPGTLHTPEHREAALRQTQNLEKGWFIQSSSKVEAKGPAISKPGFKPAGWIETSVPSTVLAAQVHAGIFKDPFVGMNLRQIPGTSYEIGTVFSRQNMPADSPYNCSWWYRTEFTVPFRPGDRRHVNLHFNGITYRANI